MKSYFKGIKGNIFFKKSFLYDTQGWNLNNNGNVRENTIFTFRRVEIESKLWSG